MSHRTPAQDLPVRVAFVEDDTPVQRDLSRLSDQRFEIIAGYSTVEELALDQPEADLVILDLWIRSDHDMPRPVRGQRAVQALIARGYKVLIYTSERRRVVLARLIQTGANGIVLKTEAEDVLPTAILEVAGGGIVLPTVLVGQVELLESAKLLPSIGPQRLRVLQGRASGEANRSIARRLGITEKAVERYTSLNNSAFADFIRSVNLEELSAAESHRAAVVARVLGVGEGDLFDPDAPRLD